MSRPRTPTHVLRAKGTYVPCRHDSRADDPALKLGGFPEPPETLDGVALKKWRELQLLDIGVLTPVDATQLELYCRLYAEVVAGEKVNAAMVTAMNNLSNQLYLNPVSRTKLEKPTESDKPANPFGQF